jgi:hypothetical protein
MSGTSLLLRTLSRKQRERSVRLVIVGVEIFFVHVIVRRLRRMTYTMAFRRLQLVSRLL